MVPYHESNIANATAKNKAFRRVVFTGNDIQLVLMSLKPNEDIGMEMHSDTDQFIRVDEGSGTAVIAGKKFVLKDDSAIIIPQGSPHNITAGPNGLKIYTVYTNPLHKAEAVHETKAQADEEDGHIHDRFHGTEAQKAIVIDPVDQLLLKAKDGKSEFVNPDGTFKGGFKGCVAYQKSKGLSEKSATKLCAYIGRRAGKIK